MQCRVPLYFYFFRLKIDLNSRTLVIFQWPLCPLIYYWTRDSGWVPSSYRRLFCGCFFFSFLFFLWLPVYSKAAVNSLTAVLPRHVCAFACVRACSPSTSCTNKERVNRSVVMFKMSQCNIYCCAPGGGFEMKCSLCLSDEGWTSSTSLPRSGALTASCVGEKLYQLCRSVSIHIWQRPSLSHLFLDHKWRELLFQPIRPPRWHHSVSSFNTSANFFVFFHCGCHLN